ncbi:UNVERIFIED_CONTAM: hypothetical protein HHA_453930 [Hammondia hammondi]|eukprot:XP_008887323.1 hypothetical protein HHA_453930 [Hammondia hammondi]
MANLSSKQRVPSSSWRLARSVASLRFILVAGNEKREASRQGCRGKKPENEDEKERVRATREDVWQTRGKQRNRKTKGNRGRGEEVRGGEIENKPGGGGEEGVKGEGDSDTEENEEANTQK